MGSSSGYWSKRKPDNDSVLALITQFTQKKPKSKENSLPILITAFKMFSLVSAASCKEIYSFNDTSLDDINDSNHTDVSLNSSGCM